MSAARIITTTEKFDKMGKLVERITEEKFTEECECKCTNKNESGAQKASNIRFSFFARPKSNRNGIGCRKRKDCGKDRLLYGIE